MKDISAADYESLICRCYQVQRYGVEAADADIYSSLLKVYEANAGRCGDPRTSLKIAKDYTSALQEISINIGRAISTVEINFKRVFEDDEIILLDELKMILAKPSMERLNSVIKLALSVLEKH